MEPFNYIGNPVDLTRGFAQLGQGIADIRQRQQAEAEKAALQAKQEAMSADLRALYDNPNAGAKDFAAVGIKYPQLSESLKRTWDMVEPEQRSARLGEATQIYSAIQAGQNDIATQKLRESATAKRNSGMEKEAKADEDFALLIEKNPQSAKTVGGLILSSVMGPEKFEATFSGLEKSQREKELQDPALQKAKAEAARAEVLARYADQKERLDLAKTDEDIKSSKENRRLRAIEVALSGESNGLKRQELQQKLEAAKAEVNSKAAEKLAAADSAFDTADNMLSVAQRIVNAPDDVFRAATGAVDSRFPTIQNDVADFESDLETLGAQAFLDQIKAFKASGGAGSLSDAEGRQLAAAMQNLKLRQSAPRLKANVKEVIRLVTKGKETTAKKYGMSSAPPAAGSSASPAIPSEGPTTSNW